MTIRTAVCALILTSFQFSQAEEPQRPATSRGPASVEVSQAKSFFETRTLEDLKKLAYTDAQAVAISDGSK